MAMEAGIDHFFLELTIYTYVCVYVKFIIEMESEINHANCRGSVVVCSMCESVKCIISFK